MLGKYDEAISCYDKALQTDPNNAQAWNGKGKTLSDLGKYNESMSCFNKARQLKLKM
jgi:tetratricopeptide (TPR) repeat protein